jgi:hypothetical protein
VNVVRSFLLIMTVTFAALATEVADCRSVAGWEQAGPAREFDPDNLFEYLDGEAEGYLIYGFVRLQNVPCNRGAGSIVLDISEMADADAAYGIFTSRRDPNWPIAVVGMGGQVLPRKATFAKGKFYVEISASADRDHGVALRAFAAEIEKRIAGRSTPPDALAWFPQEKLVSVRLIPESVLGLRALKRGYVAQYDRGKAFIVMEKSPDSAAAVLEKLRDRLAETAPARVADEAFEAEDRYLGGLCFFRKGSYLAGYANMPEATIAVRLARALASRIP